MTTSRIVAVLVVSAALGATAQLDAQQQQRRMGRGEMPRTEQQSRDTIRERELRTRIEEAFTTRLQAELGLTAEQATKTRVILERNGEARMRLEMEQRQLYGELSRQLRPGVAADSVEVGRLVNGLLVNRIGYAEAQRKELQELAATLTAVQRGQFLLMRDRLFQRAADIQQGRHPFGIGGMPPRP